MSSKKLMMNANISSGIYAPFVECILVLARLVHLTYCVDSPASSEFVLCTQTADCCTLMIPALPAPFQCPMM